MSMLIITLPNGRTIKHVLGDGVAVMGRDPSCDIPLDDPSASRRHAVMRFQDDRYVVEDLGSKNGTLVNDQRIEVHRLEHRDQILVGSVEVKYLAEVEDDRRSTVVVSDGDPTTYEPSYVSRSVSLNLSEQRLEML